MSLTPPDPISVVSSVITAITKNAAGATTVTLIANVALTTAHGPVPAGLMARFSYSVHGANNWQSLGTGTALTDPTGNASLQATIDHGTYDFGVAFVDPIGMFGPSSDRIHGVTV
jgi:hypothetical protein